MKLTTLDEAGKFYKGNIHTHTSISDGRRDPREVARIYKGKGYDFIAITDHNTVFKSDMFDDMIYVLPGLEIQSSKPDGFRTHHMVSLTSRDNDKVRHGEKIEDVVWTESGKSADKLAEMMHKKGFLTIYCHALWSRTEADEYANAGNMAMEVYNGVCEYTRGQGIQDIHWDSLLRRGVRLWGVAADDCHGKDEHYGRAFIVVKAKSLCDRDLLDALEKGSFYASGGPAIHDFHVEDGVAHIECDPASVVTFITYEYLGRCFREESPITSKSLELHPDCDYVRAEVTDENGNKAWTNPIFLK